MIFILVLISSSVLADFILLPSSVLAELALFSLHYQPASHPASHPPGIVCLLANLFFIAYQLTLAYNGRQPQIFLYIEDDLKFV